MTEHEGPNLHPGDRFTVIGLDGIEHHDTVHSIRYQDARPEIRQHPTGWRRVLRKMTPRRWRKPLPIVRAYQAASTEVVGVSEVGRRAAITVEEINRALGEFGFPKWMEKR